MSATSWPNSGQVFFQDGQGCFLQLGGEPLHVVRATEGIGDVPQARFTNPPLTTMRIPRYEMAVRAVDLITQETPSSERIVVTPELIERESVRDLRPSRERIRHGTR